jgi:haloacetate dehalogenase
MADDLARLMTALGHEKFQVAAHDRGARVTHRLCLDHPARVQRAAVLDIAPTKHIFDTADQALATAYYHWFFLIQPAPFPETLIGHDPVHFLRWTLKAWSAGRDDFFAPDAMAEYEACFSDPAVIHASCEDYRAGATIDLDHDAADIDQRIACPLLVLWGSNGAMEKLYDVLATWVPRADDLRGHMVEGGHFMAEENPEATLAAFADFFEI